MRVWYFLCCWLPVAVFGVTVDIYPFESAVAHQRFVQLTQSLRCVVCENQSIAESTVPLAGDIRRQVYEQVKAGQSDEAIVAYFTRRYGDYVRYEPPLSIATGLLWFGPLLTLVLGFWVLLRRIGRKRKS